MELNIFVQIDIIIRVSIFYRSYKDFEFLSQPYETIKKNTFSTKNRAVRAKFRRG